MTERNVVGMKAIIRKGTVKDVQGLVDCEESVWRSLGDSLPVSWVESEIERLGKPNLKESLQTTMEDPNRIILVAEKGEKIVGFAKGRLNPWGVSTMNFMGVDPLYRRKGIGRNLVEEYINESKLRGYHKICLRTAPTLKPAIRLYVELGFVPEGLMRRHAYGTDIIIYSKFIR